MRRLSVGLAILAWVLFAAAFFLPAVISVYGGELRLEGWVAASVGFAALDDFRESPFQSVLTFSAALTNLVMLTSPWPIYAGRSRGGRLLVLAASASVAINIGVVVAWRSTVRFGSGYVAWVGSFVLVALALQMSRVHRARLIGTVA
jgi:hypothetical protein